MASIVGKVVEGVKENRGVVNLGELSARLNIQPDALRGILDFCSQKGVIKMDGPLLIEQDSCTDHHSNACSGCVFGIVCSTID